MWHDEERLLYEALRLGPGEREAFLATILDENVRAEVASLLAAESAESGPSFGVIIGKAALNESPALRCAGSPKLSSGPATRPRTDFHAIRYSPVKPGWIRCETTLRSSVL